MPRKNSSAKWLRHVRSKKRSETLWPFSTGRKTPDKCNVTRRASLSRKNKKCFVNSGSLRNRKRKMKLLRGSCCTESATWSLLLTMPLKSNSESRLDNLSVTKTKSYWMPLCRKNKLLSRLKLKRDWPAEEKSRNSKPITITSRAIRQLMSVASTS